MKREPSNEAPERIAFATSEPADTGDGRHARWTELAVYYLHQPANPARRWRAVSRGLSTYPGESTREEEITVGSLDRALKLFDAFTQLGRSVIAQAEDWEAEYALKLVEKPHRTEAVTTCDGRELELIFEPGFDGGDQGAALRWLYGDELDQAKPQTLLARDFGVKESTARMQLGAGRPIMVPLTSALRYFNRPAFKKAREASTNG